MTSGIGLGLAGLVLTSALMFACPPVSAQSTACRAFGAANFRRPRDVRDLAEASSTNRTGRQQVLWRNQMEGSDLGSSGWLPRALLNENRLTALLGVESVAGGESIRSVYAVPASGRSWWLAAYTHHGLVVAAVSETGGGGTPLRACLPTRAVDFFPHQRVPSPAEDCSVDSSSCSIISVRVIADGMLEVRTILTEGYGGGAGTFETTHLFQGVGEREVRHVLALRSAADVLYAGEWNEDGTREHTIAGGALDVGYVRAVGGPPRIIVRPAGRRAVRTLQWDQRTGTYQCSP